MANKIDYIRAISLASNRYGDKLLALMEYAGTRRLADVTEKQAQTFYEKVTGPATTDGRRASGQ